MEFITFYGITTHAWLPILLFLCWLVLLFSYMSYFGLDLESKLRVGLWVSLRCHSVDRHGEFSNDFTEHSSYPCQSTTVCGSWNDTCMGHRYSRFFKVIRLDHRIVSKNRGCVSESTWNKIVCWIQTDITMVRKGKFIEYLDKNASWYIHKGWASRLPYW